MSVSSGGAAEFFVTGGTLRSDSSCYVSREADRILLEALRRAELCYILTSRQMGKSSLMVRVAGRLKEESVSVAIIDLTALGRNLTVGQWYDGMLARLGMQLGLEQELSAYSGEQRQVSPLQRFTGALGDVVRLKRQPLVIFIDEIDTIASLPFSADEFLASIRELHNRRAEDEALRRLTFCLIGVATPADLIQDSRTTPFNVGRRIELGDFTEHEARTLASGLARDGSRADALLGHVLQWTAGHPYLTQRLCKGIVEDGSAESSSDVARVCRALFLGSRSREADDNLLFIRERLFRSGVNLTDLLELYKQVRCGKPIPDDETDPLLNVLRLTGLVGSRSGRIHVRNRIYLEAFNDEWVRANMPAAELRRQREAYRRGAFRAASIAAAILATMAVLVGIALRQRWRAEDGEARYRRFLYAAQMNLAFQAWEAGDMGKVEAFLDAQRSPSGAPDLRGLEWHWLSSLAHPARRSFLANEALRTMAVSPEGNRVAAASERRVFVWNINAPMAPEAIVDGCSVAFTRDGKLVTGRRGAPPRIWAGQQATDLALPEGIDFGRTYPIACSPTADLLAAGAGSEIVLWDVPSGTLRQLVHGHTSTVVSVAFSPDGSLLASTSADNTVRVWHLHRGEVRAVFNPGGGWTQGLAFSPDNRRLVVTTSRPVTTIWDLATRQKILTLGGHTHGVFGAAWAPNGSLIATASGDTTVRLWDATQGREIAVLREHNQPVWRAIFSPDSTALFSASEDGTLKTWDVDAELQRARPRIQIEGGVRGWAFSPSGQLAAAILPDMTTIAIYRVGNGELVATLRGHADFVSGVVFSPDERTLASSSGDGTVRLWHIAVGSEIMRFVGHTGAVQSVAFSGDGKFVISGGSDVSLAAQGGDHTVRVWNVALRRQVAVMTEHTSAVVHVAASPDGRLAATGEADKIVHVRHVPSGATQAILRGHMGSITCIRFAPDNRTVVSCGEEGIVRIWAADTGHLRGMLRAQLPSSAAFSEDGRRLLVSGRGGRVWLFDSETFDELGSIQAHVREATAAFGDSGANILTGGREGVLKTWRILSPSNNLYLSSARAVPAHEWP